MALFFASDRSSFITGQHIAVDGGLTSVFDRDLGQVVSEAFRIMGSSMSAQFFLVPRQRLGPLGMSPSGQRCWGSGVKDATTGKLRLFDALLQHRPPVQTRCDLNSLGAVPPGQPHCRYEPRNTQVALARREFEAHRASPHRPPLYCPRRWPDGRPSADGPHPVRSSVCC